MDVLSDILDALRLRGTLYFFTEFHSPWGVQVPAFRRVARFHLVARGSCWVRVDGIDEPVSLGAGDLVLIPRGAGHLLSDTSDRPCLSVDEVVEKAGFAGEGALVHGGDDTGAATRLVCGHFELDDDPAHPLVEQLPPVLVVRWDDALRDSPLEGLVRFVVREVREGRPGYESVVRRLSEVVFVQAVRAWSALERPEQGILAALADPGLGRALRAIHADPAGTWTLDTLGSAAAMGRTAFAARFRSVVGETPHRYLTRWRVQVARRLLVETRLTLEAVAERVGYDSAASLSRVFRDVTGTSPGAFRRAARGEGAV